MLDQYLSNQIYRFVDEFRMVEERQILWFFSDMGESEVKFTLNKHIVEHRIHRVKNTTRLVTDIRINNLYNYDAVIDALDVMMQVRSSDVSWYSVRDVPFEIEFCLDNNCELFTVAVFTKNNWPIRYEQTKRLRTLNLPIGEPDPRKHIAVVSDESLIEKIKPLGFSMYVKILDRNTGEIQRWFK